MSFAERSFAVFTFPAKRLVKHGDNWRDMISHCKTGADMFGGAAQQRISSVDIKITNISNIGGHTAAGKPTDIIERIDQAGKIIKITQSRWAINPAVQIKCLYGRPACAEKHAITANFNIMFRVTAMQDKLPSRAIDKVFHHIARITKPPAIIKVSAFG